MATQGNPERLRRCFAFTKQLTATFWIDTIRH